MLDTDNPVVLSGSSRKSLTVMPSAAPTASAAISNPAVRSIERSGAFRPRCHSPAFCLEERSNSKKLHERITNATGGRQKPEMVRDPVQEKLLEIIETKRKATKTVKAAKPKAGEPAERGISST
ncbi:hypothetical protein [Sinorhizobium fredii]|uniref:hypothetical protein n=1 Tax=Rhizobium fredii TaxID=380 RepID=UPI0011D27A76